MIWPLVRSAFFLLDAERAHDLALAALANPWLRPFAAPRSRVPADSVRLWGLTFRNRLGLAAGFDKNAVALPAWFRLGFGFVEIGTVTRVRQEGNAKPRVFRIPRDGALINRMGFPNDGPAPIRQRLLDARRQLGDETFPIGVNIGRNKGTPNQRAADDYVAVLRELYDVGDYFVVNISSPNTPGLRHLQSPEALEPILSAMQEANHALGEASGGADGGKPLLVKIAPDLEDHEIAAILRMVQIHNLSGIVATNTTLDTSAYSNVQGGLSGRPLRKKSTAIIRFISHETGGRLPIIAVGGVFTHDDYNEKLDAGASLVQVYTGFIYGGPRTVDHILRRS